MIILLTHICATRLQWVNEHTVLVAINGTILVVYPYVKSLELRLRLDTCIYRYPIKEEKLRADDSSPSDCHPGILLAPRKINFIKRYHF